MRLPWTRYPHLLRQTLLSAIDDNCLGIAKAAAYSALLSFFPVLTSAAAILVQAKAEFVSAIISSFLFEVVPPGTEEVVRYQFAVRGARSTALLVIAASLSLWAASGVMSSLMQGFQAAYKIAARRSIPHNLAVALLLVLLSTLPLLVACALMLFGGYVDRTVIGWLKVDPLLTPLAGLWQWLSRLARYLVAFGAAIGGTCLLYYFGPYRPQRWSGVWRGAVLATVLWLLATAGFGWYVRNMTNYNLLYGSVGASLALLVWMYLMSLIALLGCEFNAECERSVLS
ncbi:MAG: YihY/virulence factor BrkB family protein [Candidatus Solibacter usitatus]|nr:YihY/virulence factor BrkB family protein [Candidatus Solibacter usitatus]